MSHKLGSIKIENPEITHKSPLNDSISKQQFSFPKSKRFDEKLPPKQNDTFYNLPSTNSNRAPSLGTSNRNTFNLKSHSPPPTAYDIKGTLDNHGVGFSCGREVYYFIIKKAVANSFIRTNSNPGPGSYHPNP